ncbi:hypothetical protein A0H81_09838 [Grifola frondosa]|uniref:DUF7704 domain-containing protein n=1 Tax=Grifola frondosa TaxID=5627 RepID=A0A1C7LZK3_GRIFR|nr:hypothetical protein A0H81_09838 [Grifola frondosa]
MASETSTTTVIPLFYRLFFLYIEPISALVGSYYAAGKPAEYLAYLTPASTTASLQPPPISTLISLFQLSNLYLLFALNEHLVLSATNDRRTWQRLLFCLLVADIGHLATMWPLALEKGVSEVYAQFWRWTAMEWGSIGFVYVGAMMRTSFFAGVGLRNLGSGEKGKTS